MSSKIIKKHLEDIEAEKTYDQDFLDILKISNAENEDADATVEKLIRAIKQKHVESKENKT